MRKFAEIGLSLNRQYIRTAPANRTRFQLLSSEKVCSDLFRSHYYYKGEVIDFRLFRATEYYLVWTSLGIIFVLRSLYSKFNGDVLHIQVPWDGYLKYFQPKPEYKANRYTIFGPHGLVFAHIAFFSGSSTSQFCSSV